jgi:hypothetical protein
MNNPSGMKLTSVESIVSNTANPIEINMGTYEGHGSGMKSIRSGNTAILRQFAAVTWIVLMRKTAQYAPDLITQMTSSQIISPKYMIPMKWSSSILVLLTSNDHLLQMYSIGTVSDVTARPGGVRWSANPAYELPRRARTST